MKKAIAIVLSALVLVACLAVARWADGKNNVCTLINCSYTDPNQTMMPGTTSTAPTTIPATEPTTPKTNPDDIENGLGWG